MEVVSFFFSWDASRVSIGAFDQETSICVYFLLDTNPFVVCISQKKSIYKQFFRALNQAQLWTHLGAAWCASIFQPMNCLGMSDDVLLIPCASRTPLWGSIPSCPCLWTISDICTNFSILLIKHVDKILLICTNFSIFAPIFLILLLWNKINAYKWSLTMGTY